MAECYEKYRYLLNADTLSDEEKVVFKRILKKIGDNTELGNSLKYLTKWLERYHGKKVEILWQPLVCSVFWEGSVWPSRCVDTARTHKHAQSPSSLEEADP